MRAMVSMGKGMCVDTSKLDDTVNYVGAALIRGDVEEDRVKEVQERLKSAVRFENGTASAERIKELVITAVTRLMGTQTRAFVPFKGECKVVLVAGHRGAGKTMTCVKYAAYYRQKGFKTGVVWTSVTHLDPFSPPAALYVRLALYCDVLPSRPHLTLRLCRARSPRGTKWRRRQTSRRLCSLRASRKGTQRPLARASKH